MSPKVVATAFALLMFTSALPVTQASHTDALTPAIPGLPHARPTQECLPSSTLDDEILIRANQLAGGDPAWYMNDVGVPSLCIAGGVSPEWVRLVQQADAVLENLRNASREVQRQVDYRLEHTLPASQYPNELVEPRTVLLDERFDGRRYTGFGDWQVVTERGEEPLWSLQTSADVNGTRTVYRFGNEQGYERGAHQFLVSPEIDMTALKGNETAIQTLAYLRVEARERLWHICNTFFPPGQPQPPGEGLLAPVCGEGQPGIPIINGVMVPNLGAVVEAYQMAFDQTIQQLPVMQHAAHMDITYRLNMAPAEDGVRVWVYSGDRAPDRRVLFDKFFGRGDAYQECTHEAKIAGTQVPNPPWGPINESIHSQQPTSAASCNLQLEGGDVLVFDNMTSVQAFKSGGPLTQEPFGFSGNISEFRSARVNLTSYIGERIWLLLEVKTLPNDRGTDIFSDTSRFGRPRDYGFELARVHVEGDGYHRNLRLKDVAAGLAYVSPNNDEGDTSNVRIAVPPGDEPVTVWVHNAGDYVENATLSLRNGTSPAHLVELREILPDEVRTVKVPWGKLTGNRPLANDTLYHLNASIAFITNSTPTLYEISQSPNATLDPNVTARRAPNAAELPMNAPAVIGDAGVTSIYQPVRADTVRNLALLRADGTQGNPVQLCSSVIGGTCQEHYAGRKGEERTILVGIRNDGNAPQDASVELKLELDGVERPDMVSGGTIRPARDLLIGEVRALEWKVIPTLPGAYRVILIPHREGETQVSDALAERRMFVQRSTGLLCLDTLEERECGPTWEGDFVEALDEGYITASALGPDGTLYVATGSPVHRPFEGWHDGMLAARDPKTGVWRELRDPRVAEGGILNATTLAGIFPDGPTETHTIAPEDPEDEPIVVTMDEGWGTIRVIVPGPRGELYLFGDNSTTLVWTPQGLEAPYAWREVIHFLDGTFHNGTLLVGGTNGRLVIENTTRIVDGAHEFAPKIAPLWNTTDDEDGDQSAIRYDGVIHDIAVSPLGGVVVIGSEGALYRHDGNVTTMTVNRTWRQSLMGGDELNVALDHRSLRSAVAYEGRLYVAGDANLLMVSTNESMTEFQVIVAPPPVIASEYARTFTQLFVAEDRLHVLANDGTLASCTVCYEDIPEWTFEDLPLPTYTPLVGSTRIPIADRIVDDGARTVLLGEAGLVLDRIERGAYDNDLSWTTVPALAPRHGGVIQTKRYNGSTFDTAKHAQGYLGLPDDAGREVAYAASEYRLFLNHTVINTTVDKPVSVRLLYRPIYSMQTDDSSDNYTCNQPPASGGTASPPGTLGTSVVCNDERVRYVVADFKEPTQGDGWEFRFWDALPTQNTVGSAIAGVDTVGLFFYGIELWQESRTRWIIDDLRLQGRVGNEWQDIILWYGPELRTGGWSHSNLHTFALRAGVDPKQWDALLTLPPFPAYPSSPETPVPAPFPPVLTVPTTGNETIDAALAPAYEALGPQVETLSTALDPVRMDINKLLKDQYEGDLLQDPLTTVNGTANTRLEDAEDAMDGSLRLPDNREAEAHWEEWHSPMDLRTASLWHYTTQWADRPVFAANNELFVFGSSPSSPTLLSNGSYRLVSPVIDLSDAYDPQIVFRHAFAFRTLTGSNDDDPTFTPGDGGTIEVQYERRGEECGVADITFTCGWSRFYTVKPDGGYPTKEEMGFVAERTVYSEGGARAAHGRVGPERSFFGRSVTPDKDGEISATRLTQNYDEVTVRLGDTRCTDLEIGAINADQIERDCVYWMKGGQAHAVNLTGRKMRFAFHLHTATYNHPDPNALPPQGAPTAESPDEYAIVGKASFPGEGWYITDVSLRGAAKLGIDLRATNLTPRVGFAWEDIGVGPGTRVPINVTVENKGVFDALGYTAKLQVHRVEDRSRGITRVLENLTLPPQPVLDAGRSVNHTIEWKVPGDEKAEYFLTFEVTPVGIDRDESPLDNLAQVGSPSAPIVAKTVRQFRPEFLVSPENATADITRFIPMFLNNTGNVPLEGFAIERRITQIGIVVENEADSCAEWRTVYLARKLPTAIVDCREWTTTRAAAPGARTSIALLSDGVDASNDLFWKAPARASFIVALSAQTRVAETTLVGTVDKRINAFATYLFDDVESGTRGDAITGTWVYGPGWNVSSCATPGCGFRSSDAYAFGDVTLGRYPADADDSLVTPTLEIGNARMARVAFYHKYDLEPSFDGGLIEASADGGKTWTILDPIVDPTSVAYDAKTPLQASSVLHRTGDPGDPTYGFTGNSSSAPPAVDGWVLSQVDLTTYGNISEQDVSYEAFTSVELGALDRVDNGTRLAVGLYRGSSWCTNPEEFLCWDVQNLTEGLDSPVNPEDPEHTFWWSGSPRIEDDTRRPLQNYMLRFTIDISSLETGERVFASWWEHASRFAARSHMVPVEDPPAQPLDNDPASDDPNDLFYNRPNSDWVLSAHTFLHAPLRPGTTWRFNLSEPDIVETRGNWYSMRSDITDLVEIARADGRTQMNISFAYTPLEQYAADQDLAGADLDAISNETTDDDAPNYFDSNPTSDPTKNSAFLAHYGRFGNDSGFAIDGLEVRAIREARGAEISNRSMLPADQEPTILECGVGAIGGDNAEENASDSLWGGPDANSDQPNTNAAACMHRNMRLVENPIEEKFNDWGRTWKKVAQLPGVPSSWQVVEGVKDHSGVKKLVTGEPTRAWWTGDISCRRVVAVTDYRCTRPGSESRLVTPAIDLSKIAGENAAFSFWHRFGFFPFTNTYGGVPLTSGGVVEVQEFDPQKNEWLPWQQLYSTKDMSPGHPQDLLDMKRDGSRGGYTGVTANVSQTSLGFFRFDPPFEGHTVDDSGYDYQYLFTGNSRTIEQEYGQEGDAVDGWLQETYDVSKYIGKRVRFGFHYAISDWPAHLQDDHRGSLDNPDDFPDTTAPTNTMSTYDHWFDDRSGWWISDISIVGDVLVGKPVQLRFRAGTDGNVHEGSWRVDDVGVYGARYRENVGLFVDQTELKYGAYENSEVVIPVTIRNLGETVRRDLAIEITKGGNTPLEFNGTAPGGNETVNEKFYLKGFTLSPGQSTTVDLRVRTRSVSEDFVPLILRLNEATPGTGKLVLIKDNEVQGLLQREIKFGLQKKPLVEVVSSTIRQVAPNVGQAVEMEMLVRNPGYGPSRLNITCTAQTVLEHADIAHATPDGPDTPVVDETYPCSREGGASVLTIPAKGEQRYVFRAVPTKPGFLSFDIDMEVFAGDDVNRAAGTMVGRSPFAWRQTFDRLADVQTNFTRGNTPGLWWSHLRGHDGPGALLIGIDENLTGNDLGYLAGPDPNGFNGGCGPNGVCRARTEPIDLHNYTVGSPAFLSFWHMDRFAKHDGAQVRARILLDEQHPEASPDTQASAWTEPCILRPIGGYEGHLRQRPAPIVQAQQTTNPDPDPGDENGVFVPETRYGDRNESTAIPGSPPEFFVSDGGRWEDDWELAVFNLGQSCISLKPGEAPITLVGKTVVFELEVYTGSFTSAAPLRRGEGHGWLIDDLTVTPYAVSVRPDDQRAAMLDNTTKAFNVIVTNLGAVPDIVRLEYDAANSSAPEGSVALPVDAYVLMPGERRTLTARVTLPRDPSLLPADFKAQILARSEIDRNAVGTTIIDLAFGPRPWPELVLGVDRPTGVIQEGTEAYIPVSIENVGLVDSRASMLRIVDTWEGGPAPVGTCLANEVRSANVHCIELGSIPSYQSDALGALQHREFRWRPAEDSVGDHTLTFEVDPNGLVEEYTKTNNVQTIVVPVSDLLIPDLALDNFSALSLRNAAGGVVTPDIDADVARYEITAGEIVSFDVKIRNPGRAGATNVDIRAFIGSLSLPPKQVPYVAPGSEAVVTFVWLAQKGEYEIEFLARSEQVELSIDNNRYPGVGVTLLTVKGYEVEVEIPNVAGIQEPGTEVSFPFSITNKGNAGEDLMLRVKSPPGTHVQLPREGFFLRPGETYSADARLVLDAEAVAGEQFISIDAVARENPMKVASGRAAMRVNASYGGSIVGGVGLGAPTEIVLPIELINEGNSLEPWKLRAALPAGWTTEEKLPLNVSVPAHGKTKVELHVIVPATTAPGDRMVRLTATMPNGELRETQARVQVSPLRAAVVKVQEEAPSAERGALRIPIEVENLGNVQQPFTVVLTDVPAGVDVRVSQDTFDLAPGEKVVAALVVKPDANVSAGTYVLTGYTRFEGVIAATSEGLANVQAMRVPIVRQDIALGAIESTPRAGVQPGDRVSVKIPVHNRGLTAVADVPVHLFIDDVFVAEVILPSVAAGSRVDATFNWTAIDGVHTLTAVVDPYEDTVDGDRADNAVSQLATVGSSVDANGGVAAGRADTPGLGLVGLLAALAVGILLTRGNGSRRQRR